MLHHRLYRWHLSRELTRDSSPARKGGVTQLKGTHMKLQTLLSAIILATTKCSPLSPPRPKSASKRPSNRSPSIPITSPTTALWRWPTRVVPAKLLTHAATPNRKRRSRSPSRLAPDNFDALKVQAWLLLGRHEFGKALELATTLNKRTPDDITVYGYLADANAELGNYCGRLPFSAAQMDA